VTERDPYDVLGVPHDASADHIHDAYRRLAKRWHPDLNPADRTAEAHFKEIAAAYEVLSQADRRAAFGREDASAGAHSEPPQRQGPVWGDVEFAAATDDASGFSMPHYVEELRKRRRQNQRKLNPVPLVLAAYIALTFTNGMLLGFTTELNGIVVASKSVRPPLFYTLFFVGWFSTRVTATEYAIRGADGQIVTYMTGPACSLLTSSANRVAPGARIHKEAWRWNYELSGRSASDVSGSVECVLSGGLRTVISLMLIALGLLWRPAWGRF
jgi:hypothetical protein